MRLITKILSYALLLCGTLNLLSSCNYISLNSKEQQFLGKWTFSSSGNIPLDSLEEESATVFTDNSGTTIYKADKTTSSEGTLKARYYAKDEDVNYEILCNYTLNSTWSIKGDTLITKGLKRGSIDFKDVNLYRVFDDRIIEITHTFFRRDNIEKIKENIEKYMLNGNKNIIFIFKEEEATIYDKDVITKLTKIE